MASPTDMSSAPQDEWEDQLLVSESRPARPTPDGVPVIDVRRVNPHGAEATEARRRREEAMARAERAAARSRRLGNPVLLALGAISAIATAWLTFRPDSVREPTPSALIGEWRPLHPAYAGARLDFTTSAIAIKTPAGQRASHRIESLHTRQDSSGLLIELTYPSPDGAVNLRATLQNDAAPPRLVFEHPVGLVWQRVAAAPSP